VAIKSDEDGKASEIFMITVVPSPASAKRSGIYPGVKEAVHERSRRFIRPDNNYAGLRFAFFLLNGEMPLDRWMMEESAKVLDVFPGSESSVLITTERTSDPDDLDIAGFLGFPAVAVFWRNEIIFRYEGLINADHLISEIQKITVLHMVKNAPKIKGQE
jgi:hypothetical protein